MAAPITPAQSGDLLHYKDIMNYLVAILDKEATILDADKELTAANITEINDTIAIVLANMQTILGEAGITTTTTTTAAPTTTTTTTAAP